MAHGWMVLVFVAVIGKTFAAPVGAPAASHADQRKLRAVIEAWQHAQNQGRLHEYAQLYAAEFVGVERAGKPPVPLDRKRWLAERARRFKKAMHVEVSDLRLRAIPGGRVRAVFTQRFTQGESISEGAKLLELELASGRIVREEMLTFRVLWQPGICGKALGQRKASRVEVVWFGPAEAFCLTRKRVDDGTEFVRYGLVKGGALVGEVHRAELVNSDGVLLDDSLSRGDQLAPSDNPLARHTEEITLAARRVSSRRVVAELVKEQCDSRPMSDHTTRTTTWYVAGATGLRSALTFEEAASVGEEDRIFRCDVELSGAGHDGYPDLRLPCETSTSNYHDEDPTRRSDQDVETSVTEFVWCEDAYCEQ